jgi:dTDP-4-dehydrorhamnose 3,5-epimerase
VDRQVDEATAIEGVSIIPLKEIADPRGPVLHMLRADASHFRAFGEVYFSEVSPGSVKAWKCHSKMTQYMTVPVGRIKFALFDTRPDSPTKGKLCEQVLGRPDHYNLIVIPPGIWYGFKSVAEIESLIANCPDMPHDPKEAVQADLCPGLEDYAW